ncbi:MAG: DUF4434 domain-containing protein [Bacteroidetes bacterium]|nr:MAG: DUF4434 domain-containing protein [Bacteroidota bacterium]TAE72860.1 MAG: DUF4434 domain-containing protein [Bacteroidota bacterium]TAF89965.1 MAG: DUF4434 domain-containing protein [Bacteroidota bacterium]
MKITGTFIDEISHDIPHQNWGAAEWDADFAHMKSIGIDTVIVIRCGYRQFITYPSPYLIQQQQCFTPPADLLTLFLQLGEKYGMQVWIGLYDSGKYWDTGNMQHEIDANRFVIDELWKQYGHFKSFKGWYLSMEISRRTKGAIEAFYTLGKQCKEVSNGLPTLISPWIDGKKAVMATSGTLTKENAVSLKEHETEWNEILDGIKSTVDVVAFQDGHVGFEQLVDYLSVNKQLADKHGLSSWTNCESFDRDMPIKFLPIKFEKLRLKLEAARKVGMEKAITFEFSHFMSPQSAYPQAGHLFNRYNEYIQAL